MKKSILFLTAILGIGMLFTSCGKVSLVNRCYKQTNSISPDEEALFFETETTLKAFGFSGPIGSFEIDGTYTIDKNNIFLVLNGTTFTGVYDQKNDTITLENAIYERKSSLEEKFSNGFVADPPRPPLESTSKHSNFKLYYEASSYLSETLKSITTDYSPENLVTICSLPWVPDNSSGNNGIGETITITCTNDYHLQLLLRNGYQSLEKTDLFKKNARAKELKITNLNNDKSIFFNLKDTTENQIMDIRSILSKFDSELTLNIEVLSTYPGNKYQDLCIDSIVPYFTDSVNSEPENVSYKSVIDTTTFKSKEDEEFERQAEYDEVKDYFLKLLLKMP